MLFRFTSSPVECPSRFYFLPLLAKNANTHNNVPPLSHFHKLFPLQVPQQRSTQSKTHFHKQVGFTYRRGRLLLLQVWPDAPVALGGQRGRGGVSVPERLAGAVRPPDIYPSPNTKTTWALAQTALFPMLLFTGKHSAQLRTPGYL